MKKRKKRTATQRKNLTGYEATHAEQPTLFPDNEHQVSTCQIPYDTYSHFHFLERGALTQSQAWLLTVMHTRSDWDSGQSREWSYAKLVKHSGLALSTVLKDISVLIEKGWLQKNVRNTDEKHSQNTGNTYLITHHRCDPQQIPLDDKGRPKKCAMPNKDNSVFEKVKDGRIPWKAGLYWVRAKIDSEWRNGIETSGHVTFTTATAKKVLRMTAKTIATVKKQLERNGLLRILSKIGQAFKAQLLPKPYKKKRSRRETNKGWKPMRFEPKTGWMYSYNEKWRVNNKTGDIHAKDGGRWRFANIGELERVNLKIFNAFLPILEMATSSGYRDALEDWHKRAPATS